MSFPRTLLMLGLFLVLAACTPSKNHPEAVTQVAGQVLSSIQARSTREQIEYCGLIFARGSGELIATRPIGGEMATCPILFPAAYPEFQPGDALVATYHTHSAANLFGGPERPSVQDLEATARLGVPGYIITPGGRFWFMEATGSFAFQICGLGCLPSDPNFRASLANLAVPEEVTLRELRDLQG